MFKNKQAQNIYMIGIKGVGMTMLAQFLLFQGHKIRGSDISDTFLTDKVLKTNKIKVKSPFNIKNIPDKIDLVIYSSAFNSDNNKELKFLLTNKKYQGLKIISYAQALGELFNNYQGIAVCGSHGKTTVSAWLGYVLYRAGKSPNVLVGSNVPQFKGSSLLGKSKLFIAEVDEYQNKLKYFSPFAVILNNIDYDHPDFFPNKKAYTKVFRDFVKKIPASGFLLINGQDKESVKVAASCTGRVIKYGLLDSNEELINYFAYDIKTKRAKQYFQVNNLGEFKIKLWGEHNIKNALAVIAAARELKVPLNKIKSYLADFSGTVRRGEILGKYKGATIIDDYAHHPTEIKTTLEGIKKRFPQKKLRVVFHPHTFSRTKALFTDFVSSFNLADELIVLDIYGSAREKQGGTSSQKLVQAILNYNQKQGKKQVVKNIKDIKKVSSYLRQSVRNKEVILLMGAGDVFRVGKQLLKTKK